MDGGDTSLRALTSEALGRDMEEALWEKIDARMAIGPTWLCGDFNLPPTKLDAHLEKSGLLYKRVPFTGEYLTFRR